MKEFFHMTSKDNMGDIVNKGLKTNGGLIYLTNSREAALAFAVIHHVENKITFKVNLDEKKFKIEESFDHNEEIMKRLTGLDSIKAYTVDKNIPADSIDLTSFVEYPKN